MQDDELAELFGFTHEELALNRAGRLSDRQRQQLFFQSIGYLVRGLVMIGLSIILIATLAPTLDQPLEIAALVLSCLLIAVMAILWGFAAYTIARPRIRTATGPLRQAGTLKAPRVMVGPLSLRLSRRRWKRLARAYPGLYRAYYVRFAGNLLSLEPVSEQ